MLEGGKEKIGASEVGCYWLVNMLTVGWVIDNFYGVRSTCKYFVVWWLLSSGVTIPKIVPQLILVRWIWNLVRHFIN